MSQGLEEEFEALLKQFNSQTQQRLREEFSSQAFFHELKGAAGSLGLAALASQAADFEKCCRDETPLPEEWSKSFCELLELSFKEAMIILRSD